MKNIILLGATGYVGAEALNVIKDNPDKFKLIAISYFKNTKKASKIIKEFNIKHVLGKNKFLSIKNISYYCSFSKLLLSINMRIDFVINAIKGFNGLKYSLITLKNEIKLCLANKETIIAGAYLINKNKNNWKNIIPIDSELASIFRICKGDYSLIKKIIITASGGIFFKKKINNLTTNEINKLALTHPTWKMGKEITINSSTLMNKAFEIIEASFLFNLNINQINILIEPTSHVHAITTLINDESFFHYYIPSMQIPIFAALTFPNVFLNNRNLKFNLNLSKLKFFNLKGNQKKIIDLAFSAIRSYQLAIILLAINEFILDLFLNNKINFLSISSNVIKIFNLLKFHKNHDISTYKKILILYKKTQLYCEKYFNFIKNN